METLCDSRERMEELLKQVEEELQLRHHDHGKDFIDRILSGKPPIQVCQQLLGESVDEVPTCNNNAAIENNDDKLCQKIVLWTVLHALRNIFQKQEQMKGEGINGANNENVLPISTQDLANTSLDKALNWKAFLRFARLSVISIPPENHGALLLLCGSFLGYQAKNLSTPFDIQSGNSSHSVLTFREAFPMFLPEMAHITKFILCYLLTWILAWPLQPGVRFILMFLLISAPLYYFPELASKASGFHVDCGSLKLPLIWFAAFGALGLSLICGLVTLLMVYFGWQHKYEKGPKKKELKVSVDALSGVLADEQLICTGSYYSPFMAINYSCNGIYLHLQKDCIYLSAPNSTRGKPCV